mgnify:FL=1
MKLPKLPNEGLNKKEKKKLKIPKSQYDVDGIPILTIPDLNDINLNDEIDKYFGKEDE